MKSMTGYGHAADETPRRRLSVTLQTLNGRHLDLVLRLPEALRGRDQILRERLARGIARGRCELVVSAVTKPDPSSPPAVDLSAARAWQRAFEPLVAEGLVEARWSPSDLLRLPGVVQAEGIDSAAEEELALLDRLVESALAQADAARRFEGERILTALGSTLADLAAAVARLVSRREQLVTAAFETLRARVAELVTGLQLPPERIAQEAALATDRGDVREELDRLGAHIAQFEALSALTEPVGRRLDFLVQELFREVNTVGAKARDLESIRDVLEAKRACEQLREQVQNVE